MKFRSTLSLLGALALAIPGHVAPASAAEQPAATAAPKYTDEQKTLLKALDSELGRFEALIAKVDDARYAEFLKEQLQEFRNRRDAFQKVKFDSGRYDELRFDLVLECQRAAQWLMPSVPPPASK